MASPITVHDTSDMEEDSNPSVSQSENEDEDSEMDDAEGDEESEVEDSTAELRDAEHYACATCVKAQNADRNNPIDNLRTTSIFASLSALRLSEKFSDMTIRCGGRDFKAHRAIVCSQSSFFDGALSGGFSVRTCTVIRVNMKLTHI
jgi:hypothetical protein